MSRAAPVYGNGTSAFLASRRRGRLPAATYAPKLAAAALARCGCVGGRARRPAGSIVRDAAGRGRVSALQKTSVVRGREAALGARGSRQWQPAAAEPSHASWKQEGRHPWTGAGAGMDCAPPRPSPQPPTSLPPPHASFRHTGTARGGRGRQCHGAGRSDQGSETCEGQRGTDVGPPAGLPASARRPPSKWGEMAPGRAVIEKKQSRVARQ